MVLIIKKPIPINDIGYKMFWSEYLSITFLTEPITTCIGIGVFYLVDFLKYCFSI